MPLITHPASLGLALQIQNADANVGYEKKQWRVTICLYPSLPPLLLSWPFDPWVQSGLARQVPTHRYQPAAKLKWVQTVSISLSDDLLRLATISIFVEQRKHFRVSWAITRSNLGSSALKGSQSNVHRWQSEITAFVSHRWTWTVQ